MPPGSAHARSTGPEGRGTLRQQYDGPPRGANGLVALDVILQGNQQGGQVLQTNPSIQKSLTVHAVPDPSWRNAGLSH